MKGEQRCKQSWKRIALRCLNILTTTAFSNHLMDIRPRLFAPGMLICPAGQSRLIISSGTCIHLVEHHTHGWKKDRQIGYHSLFVNKTAAVIRPHAQPQTVHDEETRCTATVCPIGNWVANSCLAVSLYAKKNSSARPPGARGKGAFPRQ